MVILKFKTAIYINPEEIYFYGDDDDEMLYALYARMHNGEWGRLTRSYNRRMDAELVYNDTFAVIVQNAHNGKDTVIDMEDFCDEHDWPRKGENKNGRKHSL